MVALPLDLATTANFEYTMTALASPIEQATLDG